MSECLKEDLAVTEEVKLIDGVVQTEEAQKDLDP